MSLSEIATNIYMGSEVTEEQISTGNYPAIKNKDLNKLPQQFTKCRSFVNPELIKNKKYCEYGNLLISNMGGRKNIGQGCTYLGNEKLIVGNHVAVVKHLKNPKFLAYVFSSRYCRQQINKFAAGSTVFDLRFSLIKKIQIPLPSLEEQEEIVSKLDKFRKITEDFEEGIPKLLKLVEKQYEYYKEEILKI